MVPLVTAHAEHLPLRSMSSVVHVFVCTYTCSHVSCQYFLLCAPVYLHLLMSVCMLRVRVCTRPLSGDPVCGALISLIHQQHMDGGVGRRRGVRGRLWERGGRGDYFSSCHLHTTPPSPSILALGSVSSWPDHCETHREKKTIFKTATCAVGGQLNHFQGDGAFKR